MNSIYITDSNESADDIVTLLNTTRRSGKTVLLLVSGGSNINLAVRICNQLDESDVPLHLGLVDERYGAVGHADSNWQKLLAAGLNTAKVTAHPVLMDDDSIEQTAQRYDTTLRDLRASVDVTIGLFGIGTDGHTAGILPNSPIITSRQLVDQYDGPDFRRITMTFLAITQLDVVFVVAFGDSKWPALNHMNTDGAVSDIPARIFIATRHTTLYTDYKGDTV